MNKTYCRRFEVVGKRPQEKHFASYNPGTWESHIFDWLPNNPRFVESLAAGYRASDPLSYGDRISFPKPPRFGARQTLCPVLFGRYNKGLRYHLLCAVLRFRQVPIGKRLLEPGPL